jgi:type II secretory pathway component HofQ
VSQFGTYVKFAGCGRHREAQIGWIEAPVKNYSLGREVEGNIVRIAPLSVLADEYRQRATTEEARLTAVPPETRIYVLNYAKAADLAPIISRLLSPRGVVMIDPRRNAIIVRDVLPYECGIFHR